jgi:hypothetical protein
LARAVTPLAGYRQAHDSAIADPAVLDRLRPVLHRRL